MNKFQHLVHDLFQHAGSLHDAGKSKGTKGDQGHIHHAHHTAAGEQFIQLFHAGIADISSSHGGCGVVNGNSLKDHAQYAGQQGRQNHARYSWQFFNGKKQNDRRWQKQQNIKIEIIGESIQQQIDIT